ncbi:MAG: dimethyl sulfoxide reductase anchor subunit [Rhodocyclales bacterium]|jgi:phenylacetyl-CoA:acceptor oxidoreductase subunit 2|nr:dimethyl sulfoxide reductase anchor subunit [Rhodocyclales bacterium]
MNKPIKKMPDLVSPRQQRNWDWRAAANFIAGGAGGGLLLFTALAGLDAFATRAAILLGLVLIASGLTCVWFEIGRPWRALNVYKHFATSWMTREAVVAVGVFGAGGLAFLTLAPSLVFLSGVLGLTFLYSQARILAANKGIPSWRHPASVPLMVATGLAEGAGFLVVVAAFGTSATSPWILAGLIVIVSVRAWIWKTYLAGLTVGGAPEGALRILNATGPRFVLVGHVLPALLVVAALAGMPARAALSVAAGLLVVAGGWVLKFILVRRAAFTQGLALRHLPVRGQGPAGPATKPGWKTIAGTNRV